jgi:hypothetical protein
VMRQQHIGICCPVLSAGPLSSCTGNKIYFFYYILNVIQYNKNIEGFAMMGVGGGGRGGFGA